MADLIPPSDVADEVNSMFNMSQIPDDQRIRHLARRCQRLLILDDEIAEVERRLKRMGEERNELVRRELPDIFDQCMLDKIGVPGEDADVVVESIVHANIKSDWPDEDRERGFDALEQAGGGDTIRVSLEVHFGRGELEQARAAADYLMRWNEFGNRPIKISRNVPWNTLTAFVKEQLGLGKVLPMEDLGATLSRQCKIKRRKTR